MKYIPWDNIGINREYLLATHYGERDIVLNTVIVSEIWGEGYLELKGLSLTYTGASHGFMFFYKTDYGLTWNHGDSKRFVLRYLI